MPVKSELINFPIDISFAEIKRREISVVDFGQCGNELSTRRRRQKKLIRAWTLIALFIRALG